MQTTKTCPRCSTTQPLTAFNRRAMSPGGYAAACRACTKRQHWVDYHGDPVQGEKQRARAVKNRRIRFDEYPAYKRAFNLWGSTKRRTRIPPWVCIMDFVPICQEAVAKGPGYQLDHIIPLKGRLVSGLHVPSNLRVVEVSVNQAKQNSYDPMI